MKTTLKSIDSVQQKIDELGPWFHNLHLPSGAETRPDHPLGDFPARVWDQIAPHLPEDLAGWQVLDVGCNAGFYSFQLAQRGASVTAIDLDPRYLAQARWAAAQFGLEEQVTFKQMQVYDLAHTAQCFDLVLFMGVFYHLRYPLLGLDILAQKVRQVMVFQTVTLPGDDVYTDTWDRKLTQRDDLNHPGWPRLAFVEHSFAKDPTNWWLPNKAGAEALLRSSGLKIVAQLDREIYLCEPDLDNPSPISTWNESEYDAATGQNQAARTSRT
jgi:tRNA (mo5U34)-methyltransferase